MKPPSNPWPWAIILTFILFISGTVSLVVMACAQRVDLVRPDYYEEELRFQGHIDSLKRTQQLGGQAQVLYEPARERLTITLPQEHARHRVTGKVELYRPSAAGMDRQVPLQPGPDGVQDVSTAGLPPGLWKVRVTWTVENQDYFVEQKLVLGPKSS